MLCNSMRAYRKGDVTDLVTYRTVNNGIDSSSGSEGSNHVPSSEGSSQALGSSGTGRGTKRSNYSSDSLGEDIASDHDDHQIGTF